MYLRMYVYLDNIFDINTNVRRLHQTNTFQRTECIEINNEKTLEKESEIVRTASVISYLSNIYFTTFRFFYYHLCTYFNNTEITLQRQHNFVWGEEAVATFQIVSL